MKKFLASTIGAAILLSTILAILPSSAQVGMQPIGGEPLVVATPKKVEDPAIPITWNQERKNNANGSATDTFSPGWMNYYNGGWNRIDPTWSDIGTGFEIDAAPYHVIAPKNISNSFLFENNNQFNEKTGKVITDPPIDKIKSFQNVNPVDGVITPEGVLYANAFSFGDVLVKADEQSVSYLAVIRSKPMGAAALEIPFSQRVTGTSVMRDTKNKNETLSTEQDTGSGIVFGSQPERKIMVKPAFAWDSAGHKIAIKVLTKNVNNVLVSRKIIPRAFLNTATYPVFTDTTDTFNASTNDGTDATCGAGNFTVLRALLTSDAPDTTSATTTAIGGASNGGCGAGNYVLYRYFGLWNTTSAFPATDVVSLVTMKVRFTNAAATTKTYYWIKNRMAGTTLQNTDFGSVGDTGIGTGTPYGNFVRNSTDGANTDYTVTLTGLAINVADYTKVALVDNDDWNGTNPPNAAFSGMNMDTGNAGSNQPLLSVTHAPASTPGTHRMFFY